MVLVGLPDAFLNKRAYPRLGGGRVDGNHYFLHILLWSVCSNGYRLIADQS